METVWLITVGVLIIGSFGYILGWLRGWRDGWNARHQHTNCDMTWEEVRGYSNENPHLGHMGYR